MPHIMEIKTNCVGCTACKSLCPKDCITMKMDHEGFIFPYIDFSVCILCDICETVCPILNRRIFESEKKAYYGWHKNEATRYNSSSGGAFTAFANLILNDDGVVFGAVFDAELKRVVHKSTDCVELEKLQKSKYVESELLDTFNEAKRNLKKGRKVLFCGTPCQIAGLVSYIGENINLLTCDFVCHGVPSGGFFKEHLEYKERQYKCPITNVDFRSKNNGWSGKHITITITTTAYTTTTPYAFDSFYKGFMTENLVLRRSCYECKFFDNHVSDITIADFWGYTEIDQSLNDEKGISLIIANTEKGCLTVNRIKDFDLRKLDIKYADYIYRRKNYYSIIEKRNRFFELANKIGFEKAAKKTYFKHNNYQYVKYRVKEWIKKLINKNHNRKEANV